MHKDFSEKGNVLVTVVFFVLLVILVVAGYVFVTKRTVPNVQAPTSIPSTQQEQEKKCDTASSTPCGSAGKSAAELTECRKKAAELFANDTLLAETISSMTRQSIYADTEVNRDMYLKNLILKHLSCRLADNPKDKEAAFKTLESFIAKSQQLQKDVMTQWARDIYDGKYSEPLLGFGVNLAFGRLDKLCPDQLKDMCFKGTLKGPNFKKDDPAFNGFCDSLCARVEKKDPLLEAEFINNPNPRGMENLVQSFKPKVGLAYRLGGQPMAFKACEAIKDNNEKIACMKTARIFGVLQAPCGEIGEAFEKAYCAK